MTITAAYFQMLLNFVKFDPPFFTRNHIIPMMQFLHVDFCAFL